MTAETTSPPRLARALLRLACRADRWPETDSDFRELFARIEMEDGPRAARRRYRHEVLCMLWWSVFRPRRRAARAVARRPGALHGLLGDARYATRVLARAPGFTLTAILILALGVGANATMFTLVSELFWSDPPGVVAPDRLVRLAREVGEGRLAASLGYPDYVYYRDTNDVFSDVAAYSSSASAVAIGLGDETAQADAWTVSGNYFSVLGVQPQLGRLLLASDDQPGAKSTVVVLSDRSWRRDFGADPTVVGRDVRINRTPFTVVGVLPRDFRGLSPVVVPPDLYVPLHSLPILRPGTEWQLVRTDGLLSYWLRPVARLEPGVDLAAARANVELLNARWPEQFGSWIEATDPALLRLAVWPMPQYEPHHARRLERLLAMLMAVVAGVLLIAIANLAILQLARASARRREVAIRASLGAGRARLTAQLVVESLVVALAGGALGFAISYWTAGLAAGLLPFQFIVDFRPDLVVFAVMLGLSLLAGLAFGLAPAWMATGRSAASLIKTGATVGSRSFAREGLVVLQVCISIVLLSGAGLFLRSLRAAANEDLGFGSSDKLFLQVRLDSHGYDPEGGLQFIGEALQALGAMPGVSHVTTSSRKPLRTMAFGDFRLDDSGDVVSAGFHRAGPRYFETLDIPLLAGRDIAESDVSGATPVVVINRTLAESSWPEEDAVGKTMTYENGIQYTVVGVAGDAQYHDIGRDIPGHAYLPELQAYGGPVTFVLRAHNEDPWSLAPQALEAFRELDPGVAVSGIESLRDIVSERTAQYRAMAVMVTVFAGLALLLAAVGLYGVQSYLVQLRRREIGVRIALGADSRKLAGRVLTQAVRLGAQGAAAGLVISLAVSRSIQHLVYGVSPRDPAVLAAAPIVLLVALALASAIPARRAAAVAPMTVLRDE